MAENKPKKKSKTKSSSASSKKSSPKKSVAKPKASAASAKKKSVKSTSSVKKKSVSKKETSAAAKPKTKKRVQTKSSSVKKPTKSDSVSKVEVKITKTNLPEKEKLSSKKQSHSPKAVTPPQPLKSPVDKPIQQEKPTFREEKETIPSLKKSRTVIQINEMMTVKNLAEKMDVKISEVIKKLMSLGVIANINQRLNPDVATVVGDSFNFDIEVVSVYKDENIESQEDKDSDLKSRPPVVTIMGHVDHGKTSLLDAIREARVAEKEAGGITQHIGAYQTHTKEGGTITFLDTPGHEAFTSMRARGAQATDLVILVVAADDSVMPQTVEALDHARAAGVPIIVAINKCDLPSANVQKVKQDLTNHNLAPEDWGGKTVMLEVSAKQNINIDKLLEMILLESELLELKANPNRPAQGIVVESRLDPKRGTVATILVQKGTLRVGDAVVCGLTSGKVRALTDHRLHRIKEAGPAFPVEILGLNEPPQTGDKLIVVSSEKDAREIAGKRRAIANHDAQNKRQHLTLEALHQEVAAGKIKNLPLIIKADVQGSLEAVRDSLEKLSNEELSVKVIHAGVGGVNNSDIILADASDAVILGFNVRPDPVSEDLARREGVEIKTYRIIYEMVNDVKAALEGLLDPEEKEVTSGWAEVRQVFKAPKVGAVAGCMIIEGRASRSNKARLVRNGTIVYDGALVSLRRFKDDVRDVDKGYECGISLTDFQDIKIGDRIELYKLEKKARRI